MKDFVGRAQGFSDLNAKVNTLIRLGSLLWQVKGQEDFARKLFLQVYNDLTLAVATQSTLEKHDSVTQAADLRQIVLRTLARFDAKLAKDLLVEESHNGSGRMGVRSLDIGATLLQNGSSSDARSFGEQAIDSDFSGLNLSLIVGFLHRLRMRDSAAADSLFLNVLSKLASQPHVSADDILLLGNYLFIRDADANQDLVRYTPVQIGGTYFAAGISADRSGLTAEIVRPYLTMSVMVLGRELVSPISAPARKRYQAVARMLGTKAVRFAPDLVAAFNDLAVDFPNAPDIPYSHPDDESGEKLINFDVAEKELEKVTTTQARDERCLGLIATAFTQRDFGTASRLSEKLDNLAQRQRIKELIDFSLAASYIESGENAKASQAKARISSTELGVLLELKLANQEIKLGDKDAALQRLVGILSTLRGGNFEAQGLYLLWSAALIAPIQSSLALQVLGEAMKTFNDSTASLAELSRAEQLTKIQIGKRTVVLPINSKVLTGDYFDGPLIEMFRQDPADTISITLSLKRENVLGPALVSIATQILSAKKAT